MAEIEPDSETRRGLQAAYAVVTGRLELARARFRELGIASHRPLDVRASFWDVTKWYPLDRSALIVDRQELGRAQPDSGWQHLSRLGSTDALLSDTAGAANIAAELEALPPPVPGSTSVADAAAWIRALVAWKAGRPDDALAAEGRIKGDRPAGSPGWTHYDWASVEYFEGEMLFALERYDDAAERFLSITDGLNEGGPPDGGRLPGFPAIFKASAASGAPDAAASSGRPP